MSSTYGPSRSPFGQNAALNTLVKELQTGARKLDAAAAEAVIDAVTNGKNSPGVITVEEVAALKDLFETALRPVGGATAWGRELMLNFQQIANARLFASQANVDSSPTGQWMNMVGSFWGAFNPALSFSSPMPSHVPVDQVHNGRGMRDTTPVTQAARDKTIQELAGPGKLHELLKNYPAAIADPGHTYQAPKLRADVQAQYDKLVGELRSGTVKNEDDPLAPLRKWLDRNA